MRAKRNPIIATFPGPCFQIPPLTCTLPPDWSRQHSWDALHYFSGSTLFMLFPAQHAPSAHQTNSHIPSLQISPAPGLEFLCAALTESPHTHTFIHLLHSTVSPECEDPGSALSIWSLSHSWSTANCTLFPVVGQNPKFLPVPHHCVQSL